jgi:hypothetical protein
MKDYLSIPIFNFLLSIMIPLVALAVSWGVMTARLDNVDKRLFITEARVESQIQINQEIKISLNSIEKDIQYIKLALDKHLTQ